MTEREKMLKGELYDGAFDKELTITKYKCKDLCFQYNNMLPSKVQEREDFIKKILGKVGKNCTIEQPFICDYGTNIEVGDLFYANHNLIILDPAKVSFGDNVFIAPNCSFYTAGHPIDYKTRNKGLEYAKPIIVGSNVWIGGGVTVLPGVIIKLKSTNFDRHYCR